jgi:tRNA1(Val) A37 N6-methylase TrmN6
MPFTDKEKDKEYHKEYLKKWKLKYPEKFTQYMKTYRDENKKKISKQNKKNWIKIKNNRPSKKCLICKEEFKGRLNQDYCSAKCRDRAKFLRNKNKENHIEKNKNSYKRYYNKWYKNGLSERISSRQKTPKYREKQNKWRRETDKGRLNVIKENERKQGRYNLLPDWNDIDSSILKTVRERDKICVYCRKEFNNNIDTDKESFDHFNPLKPFGKDNILRSCKSCNSSKQKTSPDMLLNWIYNKKLSPMPIVYKMLIDYSQEKKEKDTTYSNLWLFRKKGPIIYSEDNRELLEDPINKYNKYSKFNPVIAENIINFWSEENDIIEDPFSGRTRALIAGLKNRRYIGFEISSDVFNIMNAKIKENISKFKYEPLIYNKDSLNIKQIVKEPIDFIFSCPPYWNLEKYQSCPGQLSDIKEYNIFLKELQIRLKESFDLLKQNKYAAFVVGDFRKQGTLYAFHSDFIFLMEEIGAKLHDIIIIQTVSWDVANYRFGNAKKQKITSKVCEYLIIFKKN